MAAFLSFAFATTAPIITQSTKGVVISHLSVECFAPLSSPSQLSYAASMPEVHSRLTELVHAYSSMIAPALPAGDTSFHDLFAPLLNLTQASGPATRTLNEKYIIIELIVRQIDNILFKLRQLFADSKNNTVPWHTMVARAHVIMASFDLVGVVDQSERVHIGLPSIYGFPLRQARPPTAVTTAPASKRAGPTASGLTKRPRTTRTAAPSAQAAAPARPGGSSTSAPSRPTASGTKYCAFALAHALNVIDPATQAPVHACRRTGCVFTHRGAPPAPLTAPERAQYIADYSRGQLSFSAALLLAIQNLP